MEIGNVQTRSGNIILIYKSSFSANVLLDASVRRRDKPKPENCKSYKKDGPDLQSPSG
jgi:hypothetical protein